MKTKKAIIINFCLILRIKIYNKLLIRLLQIFHRKIRVVGYSAMRYNPITTLAREIKIK